FAIRSEHPFFVTDWRIIFISITFAAHPQSGWFFVPLWRAALSKDINIKAYSINDTIGFLSVIFRT
ncbi:MAG: hypothetical protein IJ639_12770, partial [Ruminococcus sp.]|nr:hypothetical protein [Ruminococcus sp.]